MGEQPYENVPQTDNSVVNESHKQPSVHIDYGVFSIDVYGGPGDSLDDVVETADEKVEEALDNVKELKRNDYQLQDEFRGKSDESDESDTGRGPNGHYQ